MMNNDAVYGIGRLDRGALKLIDIHFGSAFLKIESSKAS
jgi:hypothetical protein